MKVVSGFTTTKAAPVLTGCAIDDDCDLFDDCTGALTPKWNNGTSDAADWTAMSTSFSAHADVATPKTEWAMGVSGVIDYAVYGYYTIDYVA